ncbi:MAG TPA: PTS sugar transporter subunit IIA [Tissierellales bacterium]|nr:PTS sugar transporter subunit IIA [Tissierellales bacterium]
MIGILVVTHGDLSKEVIKSAELIIGSQDNYKALGLKHGSNIEEFESNVLDQIENLSSKEGVLVFVDLYGGSPFNTIAKNLNKLNNSIKLECISGVNLPIVLEAFLNRDELNLSDLKNHCLKIGKESIKDIKQDLC